MKPHWKAMSPFLMLCVLALVVGTFSWRRWDAWSGPLAASAILFGITYLAWMAFESRITVRDARENETRADKWTAEAYGIAHGITIFATLAATPRWWGAPWPWLAMGALLFLGSVTLRMSAVRCLGRHYSHRVRLTATHEVVARGPYGLVRHPAYAGMLGAHLGIIVAYPSLEGTLCLCFLLLPAIVLRIRVEEALLMALPGYAAFAARRKRLVPGVW